MFSPYVEIARKSINHLHIFFKQLQRYVFFWYECEFVKMSLLYLIKIICTCKYKGFMFFLYFLNTSKYSFAEKQLSLHKSHVMQPALYLIPVTLGETDHRKVLPDYNCEIISRIRYFIVENVRTTRRFLKKNNPSIVIEEIHFCVLNKHTSPEQISEYLAPLAKGESVGLISEARCPAVADPGADIVSIAHRKNYRVVPLVGPSSLLMALMASGFNGQNFAFHGYLPIDANARATCVKMLESRIYSENQTQLFIETPFRNNKLMEDIVRICRPSTKLCVAANISCDDEYIWTRPVKEWMGNIPDLNKKPTIFLLYK